MNNFRELIELTHNYNNAADKDKKQELLLKISQQCYLLLKEISARENNVDRKICLVRGKHDDNGFPSNPLEYVCNLYAYDRGADYVCIVHNYAKAPFNDRFFIPCDVINDIDIGLAVYHRDQNNDSQQQLRASILQKLRQVKKKFKELNNIPDDFKKIIENNFWDSIN